jgi:hypothetical protein
MKFLIIILIGLFSFLTQAQKNILDLEKNLQTASLSQKAMLYNEMAEIAKANDLDQMKTFAEQALQYALKEKQNLDNIKFFERGLQVSSKIGKNGLMYMPSIASTIDNLNIHENNISEFQEIKDSGERYVNANGGQRDADEGKFDPAYIPLYLLKKYMTNPEYLATCIACRAIRKCNYQTFNEFSNLLESIIEMCFGIKNDNKQSLVDIAIFLEKSSKKYDFENYKKLTSEEDFYRFRRSLERHAKKCLTGWTDEFHHEAIIFNAVCLLENFTENEVMSYNSEPEKYALKGLTDLGCEKENSI